MTAALRPCPFCGGPCAAVNPLLERGQFGVCCEDGRCDYASGIHKTEAVAIQAHNAFALAVAMHEELVGLLKEAKDLLRKADFAWGEEEAVYFRILHALNRAQQEDPS